MIDLIGLEGGWMRLFKLAAALALCALTLTACTGVSKPGMQPVGSPVTSEKVDFVALTGYAARARRAYAPEAATRAQYPATVLVGSPGKTEAQYFLEQDDKAKVQYIAIRGTANRTNILEDIETRIREDLSLAIPVH